MKKYNKYSKKKQSTKEKIGFFTAFSVCLVAIGLALWSTYASIGGLEGNLEENTTSHALLYEETKSVDNPVTGVTVQETIREPETAQPSTEATEAEEDDESGMPEAEFAEDGEKLQTILQVPTSLLYPVESQKVSKEYSEQPVHNKTMGDFRLHTGADFEASENENVFAVCDGIVDDITHDDLLGKIVKITNGSYSVYYCGMAEGDYCSEGDAVEAGDVIGKVGVVPSEAEDESHIHLEVRVSGNCIDPMTVISNNR